FALIHRRDNLFLKTSNLGDYGESVSRERIKQFQHYTFSNPAGVDIFFMMKKSYTLKQ
ncbi:hypothetical protein L9F63_022508, partial [Diploptera punctata]